MIEIEKKEVLAKIFWVIAYRFIVIGLAVLLGSIAAIASGALLQMAIGLAAGFVVFLHNTSTYWFLKTKGPSLTIGALRMVCFVQMLLDLTMITLLISVTGGISSPFILMYSYNILVMAMVAPERPSLSMAVALAITLLYESMLWLTHFNVLPLLSNILARTGTPPLHLFYFSALMFPVAIFILAVLALALAKQLVRDRASLFQNIQELDQSHQEQEEMLADLTKTEATQRGMEASVMKVNQCFLSFGPDPIKNIEKLSQAAGEILGAICVLYNRKEGDLLVTMTGWQIPPDFQRKDTGEGHLCFDVIRQGGDQPIIIKDLLHTKYAESDPNVKKYDLQTYISYPVKLKDSTVASFCAVYQNDLQFADFQLKLLGMLGRAASVEEERMADQKILEQKMVELKEFHDLTVGRELKMIELEKELARFKKNN